MSDRHEPPSAPGPRRAKSYNGFLAPSNIRGERRYVSSRGASTCRRALFPLLAVFLSLLETSSAACHSATLTCLRRHHAQECHDGRYDCVMGIYSDTPRGDTKGILPARTSLPRSVGILTQPYEAPLFVGGRTFWPTPGGRRECTRPIACERSPPVRRDDDSGHDTPRESAFDRGDANVDGSLGHHVAKDPLQSAPNWGCGPSGCGDQDRRRRVCRAHGEGDLSHGGSVIVRREAGGHVLRAEGSYLERRGACVALLSEPTWRGGHLGRGCQGWRRRLYHARSDLCTLDGKHNRLDLAVPGLGDVETLLRVRAASVISRHGMSRRCGPTAHGRQARRQRMYHADANGRAVYVQPVVDAGGVGGSTRTDDARLFWMKVTAIYLQRTTLGPSSVYERNRTSTGCLLLGGVAEWDPRTGDYGRIIWTGWRGGDDRTHGCPCRGCSSARSGTPTGRSNDGYDDAGERCNSPYLGTLPSSVSTDAIIWEARCGMDDRRLAFLAHVYGVPAHSHTNTGPRGRKVDGWMFFCQRWRWLRVCGPAFWHACRYRLLAVPTCLAMRPPRSRLPGMETEDVLYDRKPSHLPLAISSPCGSAPLSHLLPPERPVRRA